MPKGIKGFQRGHKPTKETRLKLRLAKIGKPGHKRTVDEKRTIGNFHRGKVLSVETKSKIGKAHKGMKHSKETRKKISNALEGKPKAIRGEKHHCWRGGISNNPYPIDWSITLRRSIRERDRYVCQICSSSQGDIAHNVHHIDYDKQNCNPDNLITLCQGCHTKTNFNRKSWIDYFKKLK